MNTFFLFRLTFLVFFTASNAFSSYSDQKAAFEKEVAKYATIFGKHSIQAGLNGLYSLDVVAKSSSAPEKTSFAALKVRKQEALEDRGLSDLVPGGNREKNEAFISQYAHEMGIKHVALAYYVENLALKYGRFTGVVEQIVKSTAPGIMLNRLPDELQDFVRHYSDDMGTINLAVVSRGLKNAFFEDERRRLDVFKRYVSQESVEQIFLFWKLVNHVDLTTRNIQLQVQADRKIHLIAIDHELVFAKHALALPCIFDMCATNKPLSPMSIGLALSWSKPRLDVYKDEVEGFASNTGRTARYTLANNMWGETYISLQEHNQTNHSPLRDQFLRLVGLQRMLQQNPMLTMKALGFLSTWTAGLTADSGRLVTDGHQALASSIYQKDLDSCALPGTFDKVPLAGVTFRDILVALFVNFNNQSKSSIDTRLESNELNRKLKTALANNSAALELFRNFYFPYDRATVTPIINESLYQAARMSYKIEGEVIRSFSLQIMALRKEIGELESKRMNAQAHKNRLNWLEKTKKAAEVKYEKTKKNLPIAAKRYNDSK